MASIRPAGSSGKESQRHRVDGFGMRAGKVSSRFIRHCLRRARFRGLGRRAAVHRRNATGRGGFLLAAAAAAFFGALGRRGLDFFGFGPALAEEPEVLETPIETPVQAPVEAVVVAPVERPEASEGVAPTPPERPKNRRRRRKKKAIPAGGVSAVNGGGTPPVPAEPSPSEAMPDKPA